MHLKIFLNIKYYFFIGYRKMTAKEKASEIYRVNGREVRFLNKPHQI